MSAGDAFALRLDMKQALQRASDLDWHDRERGRVAADAGADKTFHREKKMNTDRLLKTLSILLVLAFVTFGLQRNLSAAEYVNLHLLVSTGELSELATHCLT